jgi:hypothetical protein
VRSSHEDETPQDDVGIVHVIEIIFILTLFQLHRREAAENIPIYVQNEYQKIHMAVAAENVRN